MNQGNINSYDDIDTDLRPSIKQAIPEHETVVTFLYGLSNSIAGHLQMHMQLSCLTLEGLEVDRGRIC